MAKENTALTTMDDAVAAQLLSMVDKDDAQGVSIPILKINYTSTDDGSIHPKWAWVVGQQKDKEGNITDQGKVAKALVILSKRNRFSFYNKKDTSQNCSSKLHKFGEQVHGSNHGHVCGSACPFREKDRNPRCKAQQVIFGVALCEDGTAVDCMTYIQGNSYVPFMDYYKGLTRVRVKSGFADIPPFVRPTLLESQKEKYDATVYYIGVFKQGPMFDMDKIKAFEAKRDMTRGVIEQLNAMYGERRDNHEEENHSRDERRTVIDAEPVYSNPATTTFNPDDDIPFDVGSDTKAVKAEPVATKAAAAPTVKADDQDDFDIESAIKAALGKAA